MAMRIKFAAQIMKQIWICGFFLVRAASLFTLRTFGAQINWRVISRKILFDPHRYLSNKSPTSFILLERAEKKLSFSMTNGMFKTKMDIYRHGPRLMPNNCKNLNPPYFSLPITFKARLGVCKNCFRRSIWKIIEEVWPSCAVVSSILAPRVRGVRVSPTTSTWLVNPRLSAINKQNMSNMASEYYRCYGETWPMSSPSFTTATRDMMSQSGREPPTPCTAGEYSSKELFSQILIRLFGTSTLS